MRGSTVTPSGLHNKLLKPLAQGASRFEKLLARLTVGAFAFWAAVGLLSHSK